MFGIDIGNLVVHLSADARQFESTMRRAEAQLSKTGKSMQRIGRSISMYITAPLAAIGIASLKAFGDFDQAITESTAIMGNVSDSMKTQMEETARSLARNTITSAKDLGKSYYYLASAGLNAEQSIASLATVNNFAIAGMFNMSQATDLLTDAQTALGLSSIDVAKNQKNMLRVSDVLVKANTLANASVEQFSRALTNKAASAVRMLNKDVEEGVAVLAAYADQGLKGEAAGEALNIVTRDLQRSLLTNRKEWEKQSLSVYDANGKMRSYADIIGQLETKFGTLTDEGKKAMAMQLGFQDRSFSSLQMLIGMSDKIREYEAQLRKAGGTTKEVADDQMKSFNAQMKILWNKIKDVGIALGQILAPSVTEFGNSITDMLTAFRELNEETKKAVVYWGFFAAVVGPVLIAFGGLIRLVAFATGGFRLLLVAARAAFTYLAGAATLSLSPFALMATGVLTIIAGLYTLRAVWNDTITSAGEHLRGFIGTATREWRIMFQNIKSYLENSVGNHKIAFENIGLFIRSMANTAIGVVNIFWGVWSNLTKFMVSSTVNAVKLIADSVKEILVVLDPLSSPFEKISAIKTIVGDSKEILKKQGEMAKKAWEDAFSPAAMKEKFQYDYLDKIAETAPVVFDKIQSGLAHSWGIVKMMGTITSEQLANQFKKDFASVASMLKGMVPDFLNLKPDLSLPGTPASTGGAGAGLSAQVQKDLAASMEQTGVEDQIRQSIRTTESYRVEATALRELATEYRLMGDTLAGAQIAERMEAVNKALGLELPLTSLEQYTVKLEEMSIQSTESLEKLLFDYQTTLDLMGEAGVTDTMAFEEIQNKILEIQTLLNEGIDPRSFSEQISSGFRDGLTQMRQEMTNFAGQAKSAVLNISNTISNGLTNALTGVIQGTKTASQAFKELGLSIVQSLVQAVVQMGINFAMAQTFRAADTATSTAAAATTTSAWSPAAWAVSLASLGLNAIPAIAAMLMMPALATGTNYIPQDGMAFLHQGEAVVPRKYNPAADGKGSNSVTREREIVIYNLLDKGTIAQAMAGEEGENVIVNHITAGVQRNRPIRRVIKEANA